MRLLTLAALLLVAVSAHAKELTITAEYLVQRDYTISYPMPCDWDGELSNTTLFGYYGEPRVQHDITPLIVNKFGSDLLLQFSPDVAALNGEPLREVTISYPETRKRCTTGSGMDLLTK